MMYKRCPWVPPKCPKFFGAKVFKFLWRVIFGGGWAETKTGLCPSSDFHVIIKCVMEWNSRLKPKHYICVFETNMSVAAKLPKQCVNILADSEMCIKYKDLGALVSRWSKWNAGEFFFTLCYIYKLITWKTSYLWNIYF